jgi:tRNA G18 (ribose-2'-O)-methylase SpoU
MIYTIIFSCFITKGCVDAWSPKVLRSAMGSHFYIPIYTKLDGEQTNNFINKSNYVFLADNNENDENSTLEYSTMATFLNSHTKKDPLRHVTLVIGGESHGISLAIRNQAKLVTNRITVKIPLEKNIESLNCAIAFAILGYEIRRLVLKFKKK